MSQQDAPAVRTSKAGSLFDLRYIMAALFAIYGTVVTIMGASGASPEELAKADGWNVNLWCGIAMLVVALLFSAWAKLRPMHLAAESADDPDPDKEAQPA